MEIVNVKEFENSYQVNDAIFVPKAENNADYQAIKKWITDGGVAQKEDFLAKTKLEKISEIKAIRDQRNIEPITDYKAFLLDSDGNKSAQESSFIFHTNRHQTNPASDPDAIISRVLDLGAMPYFTKDANDNKITTELTPSIARLIRQKIADRNDTNYKLYTETEAKIKSAQTIEEVKAITMES